MNKKNTLVAVAMSVLMAASLVATAAPKCSLKTLKGTYIYSASGTRDGIPFAESGQEVYDGKGNVMNYYTDNTGESGTSTATYTMGENCIGESTYSSGESYAIYASPNGSEFTWVAKSKAGDSVSTGTQRRVTTAIMK